MGPPAWQRPCWSWRPRPSGRMVRPGPATTGSSPASAAARLLNDGDLGRGAVVLPLHALSTLHGILDRHFRTYHVGLSSLLRRGDGESLLLLLLVGQAPG